MIAAIPSLRHGALVVPRSAEHAYEAAKAYLSRDSVERSLVDRLEHCWGRHFVLKIDDPNDDSFDPATGAIAWDPHSALRTTGGGRQSPALGLATKSTTRSHRRASKRDSAIVPTRYDTEEERRVITGSERHAARTLHESIRHDHEGRCYRVVSPTNR